MLSLIKRIIRRVKEIARTIWTVCFSTFAVLTVGGCAPLYYLNGKSYQFLLSIIIWILALICLVIAVIAFIYDFKTTWQKDKQAKAPKHLRFDGKTIQRF